MRDVTMRPVAELAEFASRVRYVLTDIDDTLTSEGKLTAGAYQALWELKSHGFSVIPVTGRPAGWCDLIIRLWPVDAVVGENGAFVYYREGDSIKTLYHHEAVGGPLTHRLVQLRDEVLTAFPEARIARDQPGRLFDIAIDFCEDPPDLGFETAERIQQYCESRGAIAKISSIHVNAWFGDYDKRSMTVEFFSRVLGISEGELLEQAVFCGDSPNDQPMFEMFPLSCAVANISLMMDYIHIPPAFVTKKRGGEGFAEIVEALISSQR